MKKLVGKILLAGIPLYLIAIIMIVVDPYFHYHKPLNDVSYYLDNERCQNDGILKNYEYNAVITGTSIDEVMKPSTFDDLYGATTVKIPYAGTTYAEIHDQLERAYANGAKIDYVQSSLFYSGGYLTMAPDAYREDVTQPDYLYDNKWYNDYAYVLNINAIDFLIKDLKMTIKGQPSTTLDGYANWTGDYALSTQATVDSYTRPTEKLEISNYTKEQKQAVIDNLTTNVVELAKEHPETTFVYYVPPYSVLYWDQAIWLGVFDLNIDTIETAMEVLLEQDNIKLYYFADATEYTTALDRYFDVLHFDETVCDDMMKDMKANKRLVTKENYKEFIANTKAVYADYDYEQYYK